MIYKIIDRITLTLCILLIALAGYIVFSTTDNNSNYFLGYKPVLIETDRMSPALKKYDIAIIKKTNDVNIGDIACYVKEDKLTTHKVKKIVDDEVITESSSGVDPYKINLKNIDGKVIFKFSFLKTQIKMIRDNYIIGSIFVFSQILIFICLIFVIKDCLKIILKKFKK